MINLYYSDGYRNGYLDAMLGKRSQIAITSLLDGYAWGYVQGQSAWLQRL